MNSVHNVTPLHTELFPAAPSLVQASTTAPSATAQVTAGFRLVSRMLLLMQCCGL